MQQSDSVKVFLCTLLIGASLSACSVREDVEQLAFLDRGMHLSVREIPEVSPPSELRMHGFLPLRSIQSRLEGEVQAPYEASLQGQQFHVVQKGAKTLSAQVFSRTAVTPGDYTIEFIQEEPLWYAPDSYFESRGLPVPPVGDAKRFLKGVLGEKAFFLDSSLTLFCGEGLSSEVAGIQLDSESCQDLPLHVGDKVVVFD